MPGEISDSNELRFEQWEHPYAHSSSWVQRTGAAATVLCRVAVQFEFRLRLTWTKASFPWPKANGVNACVEELHPIQSHHVPCALQRELRWAAF